MGDLYRLDFPNGKSYIGITRGSAALRFKKHMRDANGSAKGVVYHAWRKYGQPTLTVLAVVCNGDLLATEKRAIEVFGTLHPHGYNLTPGGDGAPSLVQEVARKISESLRGRTMSDEVRKKVSLGLKGRRHSQDSIARMRVAQAGKTFSAETRAKMAAAKRGSTIPEEVRQRMSASQKRRRAAEKGIT